VKIKTYVFSAILSVVHNELDVFSSYLCLIYNSYELGNTSWYDVTLVWYRYVCFLWSQINPDETYLTWWPHYSGIVQQRRW